MKLLLLLYRITVFMNENGCQSQFLNLELFRTFCDFAQTHA